MATKVTPINASAPMSITSLSDLQTYQSGVVVRLPDFSDGQPFVARLKRPSMLVLAKSGKIPNQLLATAGELFVKGSSSFDPKDKNMLGNFYDTCKVICEAALVEPTMQDIEDAGIELTDEQLMAIFNYTQAGTSALKSFRQK